MVLRKYIESIVLTKVFAVYCSTLLNVLHNGHYICTGEQAVYKNL